MLTYSLTFRIGTGLFVAALLSSVPATAGVQADDGTAWTLDEYLNRLTTHGFAGCVFVARDGRPLLKAAYGLADRERDLPLTTDAVMTTGSLTKQFTGTLIALLEHEGLLTLDDTLDQFFEDVPEDKQSITVRHLLSHSAGLPGALGSDTDLKATREWVFAEAMRRELLWKPGTRRSYSNTGYSLLAMIIEELTGNSYEEVLLERLFEPAGMFQTGMVLPDFEPSPIPRGYRNDRVAPTFLNQPMLPDGPTWNLRGNGGVLTTLEDMYRWYEVLQGADGLLPEEVRDALNRPLAGDSRDGYGYGWGHVWSRLGGRLVEHDGGNGIFNADFHRYVDQDVAIFCMTSVSELKGEHIIEGLEAIVFGAEIAMPPRRTPLVQAALAVLEGTYRLSPEEVLVVRPRNSGLLVRANGPLGRDLLSGGEGSSDPERERAEALCLEVTRAWVGGDYEPLISAFGGQISLDQLHEMFGEELSAKTAFLGALVEVDCLPQDRSQPGLVVLELRHLDGSWYLMHRVLESEFRAIDVRNSPPPGTPSGDFVPVEKNRFESFGLLQSRSSVLEFSEGNLSLASAPGRVLQRIR